jgi:hypothetical protein
MTALIQARILRILDDRGAPFSYRCNSCNRCCHEKLIPVNPYEIARIAGRLGLSTSETIDRFTSNGSALAFPEGACTFLTGQGCSIHPDRPLVCRLYPLGRVAQADGTETIVELQPHPESEGENGTDGTVEQYFESQGAAPMMAAARRYHALLGRVMDLLAAQGEIADTESSDSNKVVSLVDVDPAVEEHCAKLKLALPEDPWIKMEIHIAAVNDWLDTFDA